MWRKLFSSEDAHMLEQKETEPTVLDPERVPAHIAIIMDGNGRWAQKRGLLRTFGHREGVKVLKNIVKAADCLGVRALTAYAFSTENWKRPRKEVDFLMSLFSEYLEREIDEMDAEGIRLNFIGRLEGLSPHLQSKIESAQRRTEKNQGLILTLAVNYGSKDELTRAVQIIAKKVLAEELQPEEITEKCVEQALYTSDLPPVDLLIRPSGDLRISNFLLWQIAYAEFWFTPVNWPEFTPDHLREAIAAYQSRERRFGGLKTRSANSN